MTLEAFQESLIAKNQIQVNRKCDAYDWFLGERNLFHNRTWWGMPRIPSNLKPSQQTPAVHDGYNPDGVDFTHYPIPAGWRLVTSEDMEKDKREYAKRGLKVFSSCGWKNVEGNNLSSFWCKFTYITKIEFPKSTLSLPPIPVGFRFATKEDLMKKKKDFKEVMYYCSDQKKWVCPISNIVTFSCDDLYIVKDK